MTRNLARVFTALALATVAVLAAPQAAQAANKGAAIGKGSYLNKGDYLRKAVSGASYAVELIMQQDGNLVLKRTNGHVCFAAGTAGRGHHAVYQRNGDFVVVNSSGSGIWHSNTVNYPGSTVSIESNGDWYVGQKLMVGC